MMRNLFDGSIFKSDGISTQNGFTLIELMIVVIVIGVLAAIAIPAYKSSIQQSRRTDAKAALLDLATRQEKFYSVNNQYTTSAAALYGGAATFPLNVQSGNVVYYTLQAPVVTAATATTVATFSAQATRVSGTPQASDACGDFTIDSAGVTGNINNTSSNCW